MRDEGPQQLTLSLSQFPEQAHTEMFRSQEPMLAQIEQTETVREPSQDKADKSKLGRLRSMMKEFGLMGSPVEADDEFDIPTFIRRQAD